MVNEIFKPVKITSDVSWKKSERSKVPFHIIDKKHLSLEDIIMIQEDEPKQKSCIYKMKKQDDQLKKGKSKYAQIRVKSIKFQETEATAIYFYDFTHHMESLKLEKEVSLQKNYNNNLKHGQITISHEFRTPLSNSLMLLDNVLTNEKNLSESTQSTIWLVISLINMLLCLVNDQLDL